MKDSGPEPERARGRCRRRCARHAGLTAPPGWSMRAGLLTLVSLAATLSWAQTARVPRRGSGQDDVRLKPTQTDVVVGRDGSIHQGVLQGCGGGVCAVDNHPLFVRDIAWIGLGVDPSARPPAPPADRSVDGIQVGDGALQPARLVGINDDTVVTERGSFPRSRVDWIYIAPAPGGAGFVSGTERGRPDAPPGVAPPPPPSGCPRGCPPSGASPAATAPAGTGSEGAVWVGAISGRLLVDHGAAWSSHTFLAQVRARERVHPTIVGGNTVHETVTLEIEKLIIADAYESAETWPGGARCTGSGQVEGSSAPAVGLVSRKVASIDLTPHLGYDLPAGGGFYTLALNPPVSSSFQATCTGAAGAWTTSQRFVSAPALVGRTPARPPLPAPLNDPEVRRLGDGRMAGAYNTVNAFESSAVSWSLCREGVDCPPPAPLPPRPRPPTNTDPCAPPAPQQALLQVALDQQKAMAEALARTFDQYQALARRSEQWRSDYEQAALDCRLTQVAKTLTGFLVSNPGLNAGGLKPIVPGGVPPGAARALEQFVNFLNFMERVTAGDAAWLLPDQSFNDLVASGAPAGTQVPGGPIRVVGALDAETIYDIVSGVLGFLDGYVNESSAESLLADLRSCGGLTTDAVMDGAIEYLRLLQELQALMRDIQVRLNALRDQDEAILDLWSAYHRSCVEYVRCRGGDPAICATWPPPASGR